jgi:hypothetical protein
VRSDMDQWTEIRRKGSRPRVALKYYVALVRSLYTPSGVAGTGASSAPWLQEPTWPLLVLTRFWQGLGGVPTPERTSL